MKKKNLYRNTYKKPHIEKQLFYSIDQFVWRVQNKRIIAASNQFYILFKVSTRFVCLVLSYLIQKKKHKHNRNHADNMCTKTNGYLRRIVQINSHQHAT